MALELHKDHHSYKLAFPHESTYYDMKLATFSLDKYFNLIVTFPIFRWFKFTLKPPYSIVHDKLRLAIWDTSFSTFWLKFGHKGP